MLKRSEARDGGNKIKDEHAWKCCMLRMVCEWSYGGTRVVTVQVLDRVRFQVPGGVSRCWATLVVENITVFV